MKKNILIFSCLFLNITNLQAEYVDLGVRGPQYEIKEKSFKEEIAEKLKEFDFILWEKKIADGLDASLKLESNLEYCKENKQWEFDPTITIEDDIKIPYFNKVLYKKGYKYNPLVENKIQFGKYMIFIDADNDTHLALAKKYENKAEIFVVKGNVERLADVNIPALVYRDKIEGKSFKLNCLPTVYTQNNNIFKVNEFFLEKKNAAK